MFGKNPIRPPEKGDGFRLKVQEIFPTVQGEGPHTGVPSVFVRLGGCNLACDFCDTEFEDFTEMSLAEIMHEVGYYADLDRVEEKEASQQASEPSAREAARHVSASRRDSGRKLIVITGGEPLRQNIIPFCEMLLEEGFAPQIETNGTLWRELPEEVEVICSPKAPNGEYHPLRSDVLQRSMALKFIISASHKPYHIVPEWAQGKEVWLQPMDEYDEAKNQTNLDYALELAERHGYKVSIQTHKIAGID